MQPFKMKWNGFQQNVPVSSSSAGDIFAIAMLIIL